VRRTPVWQGGESRGIGKAIAMVLAAEGVDLALIARTASTLDEAAVEITQSTGRKAVPLVADTDDTA